MATSSPVTNAMRDAGSIPALPSCVRFRAGGVTANTRRLRLSAGLNGRRWPVKVDTGRLVIDLAPRPWILGGVHLPSTAISAATLVRLQLRALCFVGPSCPASAGGY
jgi:hypothetical protein